MAVVLLLLVVCCVFGAWIPPVQASNMRCPSSCTCLGNNVDCSNFGLINIPKDIPRWVTRLELQSNGITEIQPDDLIGLHNLQYLDLSNNDISVINGSVFKDSVALHTLKLDSNKLTEIPQFPAPLSIVELTMSHNHVVTIPMQAMKQMPDLQTMDLSNNFILSISNGSFPVGSKLTHLTLNSNQISVIEQGSLNNLTFLEVLRVNKNKVSELPQGVFGQLHSLKTLELMRNKIRTIKGLTFQGLIKLQVLKLKRNNIVFLKDGAFWGLQSLISLQMDHNKVVNITQAWLFGLNALKTLTLSHNRISSIEPEAWVPCKHLEKLDLTHNKLTAITETTLAHLNSLDILLFDHNQISRIDEGAFKDLEDLSTLEMNSNHIPWTMEDISGAFTGLTGLTKLGLRANAIRSIAAHAFASLPNLRVLHLEDNDITLIQENAFASLRGLEDLRFNSSKLFCDCHMAWMPAWIKQSGFQHSALGTCYHPQSLRGTPIFQVDAADFKCNNAEFPKPVILESPKSANGFKGENMTLTCISAITGDSQPRIHWKKDNAIMDDSLSVVEASSDGDLKRYTSSLHLLDIQDSMAGRYQCVVSNDFGSAFSQRAYISVYVYPVFLKVPKDVTVKAGKPAELKCAATGQPAPVISWQKDGGDNFPAARDRRMQVYPNDDRFYIMNTRPADEGVYSCMARNEAGVVITNATVTVLETPDFVQPMQGKKSSKKGETTVLQCMASGSPQPKLTWLKDDKELVMTPRHFFTVDNQILVIVDTQWSDAGTYACRMSNSLGTAKGTTELQVLSSSGEASETGSSFGLDDESTTTGIIIIAVVCCVVGTSLVWVIIIYHTRKRHEVYSATPTDETTLPGEAPSSGYMSSDKEGSYSKGPITVNGYHYQDYQMKESGYESSSGQYRANGYTRPPICSSDVDEDDKPPTLTAGDRLLRQIRSANSVSSLPYPASDWDTIGSRHSTSSGHHSGSSDPPSSHSGVLGHSHANHQLHVANLGDDQHARNSSPSLDYLAVDEPIQNPAFNTSQKMAGRQLFQTFHPTKPTNHDRSSNNLIGGVQSRGGFRGEISDRGCVSRNGSWIHNGSCDKHDVKSTTKTSQPHCMLGCSVMVESHPEKGYIYTHAGTHKPNGIHQLCCWHKRKNENDNGRILHNNSTDDMGFSSRHLHSDIKPPHFSLSSTQSPPPPSNPHVYINHPRRTHSEGCRSVHKAMNIHKGISEDPSCFHDHHFGSTPCDCSEDVSESTSSQQIPLQSSSQGSMPSRCCGSLQNLHQGSHNSQCHLCDQKITDALLSCPLCYCKLSNDSNFPQQQNYLSNHGRLAKSKSFGNVNHAPTNCIHPHLLSPVHTDCSSCGCENEEMSNINYSNLCQHFVCPNPQFHPPLEKSLSSLNITHSQEGSSIYQDPSRLSPPVRSTSVNSVLNSTIPVTTASVHGNSSVLSIEDSPVNL